MPSAHLVPTIPAHVAEFSIEIPTFDLGSTSAPSPPPASPSPIEPSSPRRPSFSMGKRPGRSSSGSSNRSASFNLTSEIQQGEVEEESSEEELTPEGAYRASRSLRAILAYSGSDTIAAAAKHEAFLKARGRHYSNEAEAMKVRTCTFSCTFIRVHAFLCFTC